MTAPAWRTLEEDVAYNCDGFEIVSQTVELPDGTTTDFDYLSEDPSVVILPFTPDGDVVVIDEWRQAVGRSNRGLPAGGLEGEEDRATAVTRELREETGYEPGTIEFLTSVEPANGFSDAVFHYYVALDCEAAREQALDVDETIEVAVTDFESLVDAVRSGDIRDGRSAMGILFYALFGVSSEA